MRAVEAPSEARPVAVEDAANGAPGGALSLFQAEATRPASVSGGSRQAVQGCDRKHPAFPGAPLPEGGVVRNTACPGPQRIRAAEHWLCREASS